MTMRLLPGWLLLCAVGCGQAEVGRPQTQLQTLQPSAPAGEMIPRPEFVNWSRFPVGTQVTRLRTTTNENGQVLVTTRVKLVSKDEQKVVVETQIDVKRPNQELERNDPMTHEFASAFALPAGMKAEQFALPSIKAVKSGSEKLKSLDKEYSAEVYEWEDGSESGPIKCKLWVTDELPGRIAQQEQINEASKFHSQEVITELNVPAT